MRESITALPILFHSDGMFAHNELALSPPLFIANHDKQTTFPYHEATITSTDRVKEDFGHLLPSEVMLPDEATILDWGCSRGCTTVELAYMFGPNVNATGLDINHRVLGRGRDYAAAVFAARSSAPSAAKVWLLDRVSFILGDGYDTSHAPGPYDAVFAMNNLYPVMGDMDDTELTCAVRAVSSRVAEDGYLCISGRYSGVVHAFIFLRTPEGFVLQAVRTRHKTNVAGSINNAEVRYNNRLIAAVTGV